MDTCRSPWANTDPSTTDQQPGCRSVCRIGSPISWGERAYSSSYFASRVRHATSCGESQQQWEHRCRHGSNQFAPFSGTGPVGDHPRTAIGPMRCHTRGSMASQTCPASPRQHLVWRGRLPFRHPHPQSAISGIGAARTFARRQFALNCEQRQRLRLPVISVDPMVSRCVVFKDPTVHLKQAFYKTLEKFSSFLALCPIIRWCASKWTSHLR